MSAVRHYYKISANDPCSTLCGAPTNRKNLVRCTVSNVNCPACQRHLARLVGD